jgi:hypothetical protein
MTMGSGRSTPTAAIPAQAGIQLSVRPAYLNHFTSPGLDPGALSPLPPKRMRGSSPRKLRGEGQLDPGLRRGDGNK